jgi:hypothetical protein
MTTTVIRAAIARKMSQTPAVGESRGSGAFFGDDDNGNSCRHWPKNEPDSDQ